MGERVRITDVSPRDGLQNEPGVIPPSEKVRLIGLLCEAGVDEVEATSFVSARWVPQLGDAGEVLGSLRRTLPEGRGRSPVLSALVPNSKGMTAFVEHFTVGHVDKVAVFAAASETFSLRNTNGTIAEVLERFVPVIAEAQRIGVPVRGYVSCAIACPFEGPIAPERVADVSERLAEAGVDEIDLGDTIGAGTAETVGEMLRAVGVRLGEWARREPYRVTLHLHDTFGRASECVRAALALGVRSFDGSVAGLGGCPYASTPERRAPGNISTQTLVRTILDAGFVTGVDLGKLDVAAAFARELVARNRSVAR